MMPPWKRQRYARVVQGKVIPPGSVQSQAGKVRLPSCLIEKIQG
jgi:hypothetical protein